MGSDRAKTQNCRLKDEELRSRSKSTLSETLTDASVVDGYGDVGTKELLRESVRDLAKVATVYKQVLCRHGSVCCSSEKGAPERHCGLESCLGVPAPIGDDAPGGPH